MQNSVDRIAIILLAAGSSSRMGQSKQLLEIEEDPLLLTSIRIALESDADNAMVVLGANEQEHKEIIKHLAIETITNLEWEKGMGSSLKKGLTELLQIMPEVNAVLVMVCDQPLLTTDHMNKLIQTFKQTRSPIVASFYSGKAGVPALFEKSLFDKLLAIENKAGAKKILQENQNLVYQIDFPQGAIDLDTPEDYAKFISRKDQ